MASCVCCHCGGRWWLIFCGSFFLMSPHKSTSPHEYKWARSAVTAHGCMTHLCHVTQIQQNEKYCWTSHYFVTLTTNPLYCIMLMSLHCHFQLSLKAFVKILLHAQGHCWDELETFLLKLWSLAKLIFHIFKEGQKWTSISDMTWFIIVYTCTQTHKYRLPYHMQCVYVEAKYFSLC